MNPCLLASGTALALLTAGCDRAPAPAASTSSAPASAAPSPSSTSSATDAASALPPAPKLPAARCTVRTSSWTAPRVRLLLGDGESPFAEAGMSGGIFGVLGSPNEAEALLPDGPGRRLGLRVTTATLHLEGLVDAAVFPIHAAKPIVLGGFAITKPWTDLKVTDVSADGVGVEADLGGTIALEAPLRARQACGDLTVEAPSFDADAALPAAKIKRRATLEGGASVALAVEPGGAAVARLTPKSDGPVDVLETSGASARIAFGGGDALVFGWVAARDLGPAPPAPGGRRRGEEGVMAKAPEKVAVQASVTCDKDVPLVAESGADRATVGRVRAKARIDVLDRAHGWARVRVPRGVVQPAPKALWKVRAADLEGCAPAKEEDSPWGGIDAINADGLGTMKKK